MRGSGDNINLHLDGNGEPHMVPESDDDASKEYERKTEEFYVRKFSGLK